MYDSPSHDVASSVIETMGKDIVVVGHTRSFGAGLHDFLLLKMDSLGNLQWVKTLGAQTKIGLTRFMRRMIRVQRNLLERV